MEDTATHTYHYTDEYVGYRGREHAAKCLKDALDEVVAEVRRRVQKSMNPGDATTWLHCGIERSDHCRDGDDPHAHYCNARDENRAPTCYYRKIQVDPPLPECEDGQDHSWHSPHDLEREKSRQITITSQRHGVIITERCGNCGTLREIDTGARDPGDGSWDNQAISFHRQRKPLLGQRGKK